MLKRLIRLSMLLLVASVLFGCSGGPAKTEPVTTAPVTTSPAATTPPVTTAPPATEPDDGVPKDKFYIYHDQTMLSTIVIPANADAQVTRTANTLAALINQRSRKTIEVVSDATLSETPSRAILVGETKLPESASAYAALGVRGATAEIANGCLVIAFRDAVSLKHISDALTDAISGDYRTSLTVSLDFRSSYFALPSAQDLPSLSGSEFYSCAENTEMIYADCTEAQFRSYCNAILAEGFTAISERESEGNLFATFGGEGIYVYAYYTAYSKTVRVLTGPIETLAESDRTSDAAQTYTPYIASIEQPNNGQGFIIRLPDGRFLIHDGGYSGDDRVYTTLRSLVPEGKIVIAAWFISHPHGDHYPAFVDFVKTHGSDPDIVLESVMMNVTEPSRYIVKTSDMNEDCSGDASYLFQVLRTYCKGVPAIRLHTGQVLDFGGATVEVLYTVEDIMPESLPNVNDSSLVIRLKTADTSFMILADTCYRSGPILDDMWGDYLKSDIVQVAHHGQWPSVERLYHSIAAKVVLIPAVTSRYKSDILDTRWDEQTEAILSYAKDLYVVGDSTVILELPYTILNNKQAAYDAIISYVPKEGEPTS